MNLRVQRKLAASVMRVAPKRVRLDPAHAAELKDAITKRDIRGLIESLYFLVSLVTDMRHIDSAKLPYHGCEFDQLIRFGECCRGIDEGSAESESSLLHGRSDEPFHFCKLLSRRGPIVEAHNMLPHLRCTYKCCQIDRSL